MVSLHEVHFSKYAGQFFLPEWCFKDSRSICYTEYLLREFSRWLQAMGIRKKLIDELRNAFAIPGENVPLTERQQLLIEKLCREIVRRGLSTPAIAFLEMSQPLNYLGAQAMHFFHPLIATLTDSGASEEFARLLERRDFIERLIREIETLEKKASSGEGNSPK